MTLDDQQGTQPLPTDNGTGRPFRPGGLTLRIIVILAMLPLAGLAAAGVLNFLKFERVFSDTIAERYDPVLRELVRAINDSLGEGLTLASTRTTEQLIKRSEAQFGEAFDLRVSDLDGTVLFSTLPEIADDRVAPTAEPLPPGEIHHVRTDSGLFVGQMSILQDGQPVGVLSLAHDASEVRKVMPEIEQQLIRAGTVAVLPVLPILVLFALILLGRYEGRIRTREVAIDRAVKPDSPDPGAADPLVHAVWRIGRMAGQERS